MTAVIARDNNADKLVVGLGYSHQSLCFGVYSRRAGGTVPPLWARQGPPRGERSHDYATRLS